MIFFRKINHSEGAWIQDTSRKKIAAKTVKRLNLDQADTPSITWFWMTYSSLQGDTKLTQKLLYIFLDVKMDR